MSRAFRGFWNFLTLLSLLLCVATAVLWVRSQRVYENVSCVGRGRHTDFGATSGYSRLTFGVFSYPLDDRFESYERSFLYEEKNGLHYTRWFGYDRARYPHEAYAYAERLGNPRSWYRYGFGWVAAEARVLGEGTAWGPMPLPSMWVVTIPHWFLMLLTGFVPALHFCIARRRKRSQPGLCPTCGYDLRASPNRCPECGTVVPAKRVA